MGGDPVNLSDPFGLRDTVFMDDAARKIVMDCAQVSACAEWVAQIASSPLQIAFRTGAISRPDWAATTEPHFSDINGAFVGAIVTFEADDAKYGDFTKSFIAAHEIGGHLVGTMQKQAKGARGKEDSVCGDSGCAQKFEAQYVASGGKAKK